MSDALAFGPGVLASAKRVVLKVGSSLLVDPVSGAPSAAWLETLCGDIAAFRAGRRDVVIVTSGAVAAGRAVLGLHGKLDLPEKQAAAAAGQIRLMRAWEDALAKVEIPAAQALLTPDDTERRRRWLNARATLEKLLEHGAAPIINENDTVATQELRYGDNDRLAARVAQLVRADVLVLLTDIDGLHESDPRADPMAPHIPFVARITPQIEAMAGGANEATGLGTGGMRTKIEAARIAARAGCATAITAGLDPRPFARLLFGAKATWFAAETAPRAAYKAWIAGAIAPSGALVLDPGAVAAVRAGKSLLAAGLAGVTGRFDKGETVRLLDVDGGEIARGVVRYESAEVERIKGLRSEAIEAAIGYTAGPVVVHADDLAGL